MDRLRYIWIYFQHIIYNQITRYREQSKHLNICLEYVYIKLWWIIEILFIHGRVSIQNSYWKSNKWWHLELCMVWSVDVRGGYNFPFFPLTYTNPSHPFPKNRSDGPWSNPRSHPQTKEIREINSSPPFVLASSTSLQLLLIPSYQEPQSHPRRLHASGTRVVSLFPFLWDFWVFFAVNWLYINLF